MPAADELTAGLVLQDFGGVIFVTLVVGLLLHAVRRSFRRKPLNETPMVPVFGIPGPLGKEWEAPKPRGGVDSSHFTWWDFLICGSVLFFFVVPIILIETEAVQKTLKAAESVAGQSGGQKFKQFLTQVFIYVMLSTMIFIMIKWVGMRSITSVFGLKNQSFFSVILWIVIGSVVAVLSVNWISNISSAFTESHFGKMELQSPVKSLQGSGTVLSQVLMIITAVILAPLFEELVFRGYFYGILKKYTDSMFAAFISGAVFGLIHMNLPAVLPLWFFAIFLTLAYEASRCLWVPIGIHAVFNAVTVIYIFNSKNDPLAPVQETATVMSRFFLGQ